MDGPVIFMSHLSVRYGEPPVKYTGGYENENDLPAATGRRLLQRAAARGGGDEGVSAAGYMDWVMCCGEGKAGPPQQGGGH